MDPDLNLQLKVAIKALGDTIGPAIDPTNKPAVEQFGLILATLGMVREHLPIQRRFVRRQLEDAIRLGQALDGVAVDAALAPAIAAAQVLLADPEAEVEELEAGRGDLNDQVTAVIASAGANGVKAFQSIVLNGAKPAIERTRAWFAGSGFDAGAIDVRPIEALL